MPVQHHANGRVLDLNPQAVIGSVPPAQRTAALEASLAEHREALRTEANPFDRPALERNISKLETAIERSQENDRARDELQAGIDRKRAEEARQTEERRQELDARIKANARASFMASNPNATEEDFSRLWPGMRDQLLLERQTAVMDQARASGRYSV